MGGSADLSPTRSIWDVLPSLKCRLFRGKLLRRGNRAYLRSAGVLASALLFS